MKYYYYIRDYNRVFERDTIVDLEIYPQYIPLTQEEVEYYLANPTATRYEIEHRDDVVSQPTLEEVKESKRQSIQFSAERLIEVLAPNALIIKALTAQWQIDHSQTPILLQEEINTIMTDAKGFQDEITNLLETLLSTVENAETSEDVEAVEDIGINDVPMTDEQSILRIELFPYWIEDISVKENERYQYNGVLYRVVTPHTTQADWTPDVTPALFVVVSLEEWPEFVQPTGGHDVYMQGDKITFNGERYISLIDNNNWSPADYPAGWQKQ